MYAPSSIYYRTPTVNGFLGIYVDREIPESEDDMVISLTTRYANRPDLLSYDLYGTAKYWWIFIRRNRDSIKDPIFDFVEGLEIYAPTKTDLLSYIG